MLNTKKGQLDPDKIEAEILANERTFLALGADQHRRDEFGVRDYAIQPLDARDVFRR